MCAAEERRVSEGLRRQLQSLQASAQQGAHALTDMDLTSLPLNDASMHMEQQQQLPQGAVTAGTAAAGGISQQQQQAVDDLMLELRRLKQVCACMLRPEQQRPWPTRDTCWSWPSVLLLVHPPCHSQVFTYRCMPLHA